MASIALLAVALSLGACRNNPEDDLADLDNQIVGNDADPALTSALEDQIMVDPALTQQSNQNAVRPPETPPQAQYPLPQPTENASAGAGSPQPATRSASAQPGAGGGGADRARAQLAQAAGQDTGDTGGCSPDFRHDMSWAQRLPAAFAVYPGSRITDAAGNDTPDCRSRVVTFSTEAPPQRVLDYYGARASRAGYSAERQMREGDHILAGVNQSNDGAFYLIVTPTRSGSDVALIANNGR